MNLKLKIGLILFFVSPFFSAHVWAKVYGSYTAGCISPSEPLPDYGIGYQSTRRSRQMHFAHPQTIEVIEKIAGLSYAQGLGTILVGNLSKKKGGPLFEHSISHQNGLDFDVAYELIPQPLSTHQQESYEFKSLLHKNQKELNRVLYSPHLSQFLKIIAEEPLVDRILIDPLIKKEICETEPVADWMKKLRPWLKHDNHAHVRLKCPKDSLTECEPQPPVPSGPGCSGPEFEWWFSEEAYQMRIGKLKRPSSPSKPKVYPAFCEELLNLNSKKSSAKPASK